ncbi:MAG: hypothetical protein WDZ37_00940 [Solirubrobacterales bacterium]
MPLTMMVMLVATVLAGIAINAGIVAARSTSRDASAKRAVAAASAGVKTTIYQLNMLQPAADQCVRRDPQTQALSAVDVEASGWCEPSTEQIDEEASYTAYASEATTVTSNGQILSRRTIVSAGVVNGVKRRAKVTVESLTGVPIFSDHDAVVSLDSITIQNTVHVDGNVASNGNITLKNSAEVCGNAIAGPGKSVTFDNEAHLCPGYTAQQATSSYVLSPVDQGNAPTQNNNSRIGGLDPWTSKGSSSYNAATRTLNIQDQTTLTFTGDIYSFCKINVQNDGQLRIGVRPPGAAVRIYMDSPENCGGSSGMGSVSFSNSSGIVNLNSQPTTLQLYLAGSSNKATSATFDNSFATSMVLVIYAPNSTINLTNSGHVVGAVAAKTIKLSNSAQVTWDSNAGTLSSSSVLRVYHRQEWIDCTADPPTSAPDSGC